MTAAKMGQMTLACVKKVAWGFAGFVMPLAVLGLLFLGLWANDVRKDRKHTVAVNAPTPVFVGSGDEDCGSRSKLTTIEQGARLRVQRIRYWKNCATLDVTLSDGRNGHIVLGLGDVSVQPPLQ